MSQHSISVFWFRRDLRTDDNHGLLKALTSGYRVMPVFIFDKNILDELAPDDRRVNFIHQQLQKLDATFRRNGGGLHVFYGDPKTVFAELCAKHDIQAVYTNRDYEPYALDRDRAVEKVLANHNVALHTFKDQVLFDHNDVAKSDGKPYTVYTPYSRKWLEKMRADGVPSYPSQDHLKTTIHLQTHGVPSLESMGFRPVSDKFPSPQPDSSIIENYAENRDFPDRPSTTKLGVHLRFGTVSVRDMIRKGEKSNETWLKELVWREFFMNILYHFPQVVTQSFKPAYDRIKWEDNSTHFEAWCNGQTGYPIVDAGMRELVQTGFMHNRARMVVASFLTKHLLIDWRKGEAFFASHLLDYDLASNNGNWQWAAGTGCDAAPYFRVFNPYTQAKKFDPHNKYIRKWVPEVDDEKRYPKPIVDHPAARKRALARYAEGLKK